MQGWCFTFGNCQYARRRSSSGFQVDPQCEEEPYHGFLGIAVRHAGETLGVIVVQQAYVRRYRDTDVTFIVTLSVQLAGVIDFAGVTETDRVAIE